MYGQRKKKSGGEGSEPTMSDVNENTSVILLFICYNTLQKIILGTEKGQRKAL